MSTKDPSHVRISNLVATALFNRKINLPALAWATSGDYNPAGFAAVQIRLLRPAATALVFASGRLVTTGACSESAALTSIYIFYRMIRNLHPDLVIHQIDVQNIVAAACFGKCVQLDLVAKAFSLDAIFDPSLFPGLRLQLKTPAVKVLIFAAGSVVLTGARNREDLALAWATTRAIVGPFVTDEDVSHRSIQINRNARKKLKVEAAVDEAAFVDPLEGLALHE